MCVEQLCRAVVSSSWHFEKSVEQLRFEQMDFEQLTPSHKFNSLIYFVENRLKLFPTFVRNVTTILLIVETESNWILKAIRNRTTRKPLRAIWNRTLRNNQSWVWIIWRKYFSCCYSDTAFHHLRSSLKYYSTILKTDFQMRIK